MGIWRALRNIVRRPRLERELELELADHLESETEALMAAGVPAAEARRRALQTMGRMGTIREQCRDSRGTAAWDRLRQDARFGLRMLLRDRTFALLALGTIAVGIGSTAAIAALVDAVVVRPLGFPAPQELFQAEEIGMRGPLNALRAEARLAEYAGHLGARDFTLEAAAQPERRAGSEVSANFFSTLGVAPELGRTFQPGEDQPGRAAVAVISHGFWTSQFGGRTDIVGRTIVLEERVHEIVGVMPASFAFPAAQVNFWVPMRMDPQDVGEYWGSGGVSAFARVRSGAEPAAANSELRSKVPGIRARFPWRMPDAWASGARLTPMQDYVTGPVRTRAFLLLAVVVLVLLIALANVANLLLAQAAGRKQEFAMRVSLGATRGRLARQLMTEGMLLAGTGGVLGIGLAYGLLAVVQALLPAETPRLAEAAIDPRTLGMAAAVTVGSGLFFGLWPMWQGQRREAGGTLILVEAALATVLLIGGGLVARSLWNLTRIDPGFAVDSLVTAELTPNRATAASLERSTALAGEVIERLRQLPGVTNAAATNVLPVTPEVSAFTAAFEDFPRAETEPQIPLWSTAVTPSHLATLGLRLLEGRAFTDGDRAGSAPVVLISKATANRYWKGRSAVGRRLRPVWQREWRTIVGVVDDVRNFALTGPPGWIEGEVYLPLAQAITPPGKLSLLVRVQGEAGAVERQLPQVAAEVCANCALAKIARMETVVGRSLRAPRSLAWLISGFAALALVMAAAGIYGVVSNAVARRKKELGIRLALGVGPAQLARAVMLRVMLQTTAGTGMGALAAWNATRYMRTLLYGVGEHDVTTFALGPALLLCVALAATAPAMLRALAIDPARSLREG